MREKSRDFLVEWVEYAVPKKKRVAFFIGLVEHPPMMDDSTNDGSHVCC